jgi:hypothetical protein
MNWKKPFFILLLLWACCIPYAPSLSAQLIEPTRGLREEAEESSVLRVLSEPPGMVVRVDDKIIGETPIFSAKMASGAHLLRIGDHEREVHLQAGKTTTMSWFKGSFIDIPEPDKSTIEIVKGPHLIEKMPKREEVPADAEKTYKGDPYYWPMNPRGPIY